MKRSRVEYFAYGSNLSKQQMSQRCPNAKPKYQAVLPNYKLIFTGWSRDWKGGTASIKPLRGDKVIGAVYEITEPDQRRLDRFEDYPATYDRINVLVLKDDGSASKAFTYIKRQQSEETKPSAQYLAIMRQGYKDWTIE
jgi:gamma-glutamylcyclotransferase